MLPRGSCIKKTEKDREWFLEERHSQYKYEGNQTSKTTQDTHPFPKTVSQIVMIGCVKHCAKDSHFVSTNNDSQSLCYFSQGCFSGSVVGLISILKLL